MIPEIRKKYNAEFTQSRYEALLYDLNTLKKYPADFRVSETPLFLSHALTEQLVSASNGILHQLQSKEFREHARNAIPDHLRVPQQDAHPTFLQIDFAICQDKNGEFVPRLIELQAFPSLYCFQRFYDQISRKHFCIPDDMTTYFNGIDGDSYRKILYDAVVAEEDPSEVVLLEIDPDHQKTRIDFACTEDLLGISTVCLTSVIRRNKTLLYKHNGKEIPIKRIYNRVIFDDLEKRTLNYPFRFTDELDVSWAGHPNWYFLISKHTLPFLKGLYAPQTFFLSDLKEYPKNLEHFVLKPLFSFAGSGVHVDVTTELLDSIQERHNYILQQKVEYAPLVETPDGFAKAEIRMMFVWNDEPLLVNNLVRMSKGKMMGVNYNKEKTWVGSSLAYHPPIS